MTIETNSMMGPGTLTLGTAGALTIDQQVREAVVEVTETVKRIEAKRVLSGEELPASETATYEYALKLKLIQDAENGGIIDYSYDNAGDEKDFSFKPSDSLAAKVDGVLRVMPVNFGGSVDDPSPESDVTFKIIGTPTFTPNA